VHVHRYIWFTIRHANVPFTSRHTRYANSSEKTHQLVPT
jgi:hypothetical protein